MKKYLFKLDKICPICKKGNVREIFKLKTFKQSTPMVLGQVISAPVELSSVGHCCDNCAVMLYFEESVLEKNDREQILRALLCKKVILKSDTLVQIPGENAKTYTEGSEVYLYTEYDRVSNYSPIMIADYSSHNTQYLSENVDGPFYYVFKNPDVLIP